MSRASGGSAWIDAARALPVADVVEKLSLVRRGSRFGPCPACKADRENRSKRPPVGFSGSWWTCNVCRAHGGPIDLVALSLTGRTEQLSAAEWKQVRGALLLGGEPFQAPRAQHQTEPPPPHYPPPAAIRALWQRCRPLDLGDSEVDQVRSWLTARGLSWRAALDLDLLRTAPGPGDLLADGASMETVSTKELFPGWPWIATLPLFDATGALRSLRWRSIDASCNRKSMAPTGYSTGTSERGLALACPMGRALLGGRETDPTGARWSRDLLVVEGEPDLLAGAAGLAALFSPGGPLREGQAPALMGWLGSTGLPSDIARRLPTGARVVIWAHPDPAGRKAAEKTSARIQGAEWIEVVEPPADLADCWQADPQVTEEALRALFGFFA